MLELYKNIENCNPDSSNMVLTALEGDFFGEKALVSDGQLVWESKEDGFFSCHREELKQEFKSNLVEIGGTKLFCDNLGHEAHLVICGGGHVAIPVIQIGVMMGCEVTVLEDRPQFANNARKAGATHVICEPFEEGLDKVPGNQDTFFVIVTRGHRYDQVCLEKIAKKKHAYIGMIGSRLRVRTVKEALLERGTDQDVLDGIYSPIGLNIGSETPAEIAVAIMAEIIEVKNKKKRTHGYSKELMRGILDEQACPEKKVLITIVTRQGSAPQGVGAKMLVMPDGKTIGTIGGGCMESDVLQELF
ncbi:MAG: XdhC family protein [Muricomes sp.]